MNINLKTIPHYATTFCVEKIQISLTAKQKKILLITSLALIAVGFIAALFAISRYRNSHSPLKDQVTPIQVTPIKDRVKLMSDDDGVLNGNGKRIYPDGSKANGDFKNGKLHGTGTLYMADGTIQKGEFKKGKLHGKGKNDLRWCGMVEEGEFQKGKLEGKGKRIHPDGRIEEGEFKKDMLTGKGKITLKNGRVVEGHFKYGLMNAPGTITDLNGTVYQGELKVHRSAKLVNVVK
jgi:hypothetical protein